MAERDKPTRRFLNCPKCRNPMKEFPMFSSIRLICMYEPCSYECDKRDWKPPDGPRYPEFR